MDGGPKDGIADGRTEGRTSGGQTNLLTADERTDGLIET